MRFLYESVAVKRFDTAILTGAAASAGTGPLEFSEKAGRLCAKSEYPGSETRRKAARHGFVGNTI